MTKEQAERLREERLNQIYSKMNHKEELFQKNE